MTKVKEKILLYKYILLIVLIFVISISFNIYFLSSNGSIKNRSIDDIIRLEHLKHKDHKLCNMALNEVISEYKFRTKKMNRSIKKLKAKLFFIKTGTILKSTINAIKK